MAELDPAGGGGGGPSLRKFDVGVLLALVIAIAGFAYWCGQLQEKVSSLDDYRDEIRKARENAELEIRRAKTNAIESIQGAGMLPRESKQCTLNQGTTVIPIPHSVEGAIVTLRLTGPYYDYRYFLAVAHNGYGDAGFVTKIATLWEFNQAGYGAPTLSVDTNSNLLVSNPNYPPAKLIAVVTVLRL